MAVITAPVLLNGGRQADYGFFCKGCSGEIDKKTMHWRNKYRVKETPGHRYGRIVKKRLKYLSLVHVKSASYKGPVS